MKKQNNILYILLFIMLFLAIGVVFYFNTPQVAFDITNQCYIKNTNTLSGSYTCPAGSTSCDVYGFGTCTTFVQGTNPIVLFRGPTSSNDYIKSTGKFDLSLNNGGLQTYSYKDQISNAYCDNSRSSLLFYDRNTEIRYSSSQGVFICQGTYARSYQITPGSPSNTPSRNCNNNEGEICDESTSSKYECTSIAKINNVVKETVTYRQSVSGPFESQIYHLTPGQTFEFQGQIKFAQIDDTLACSKNKCNSDNTGYYNCNSGTCRELSNTITLCNSDELCSDVSGTCVNRYGFDGAFVDSRGDIVTGYNVGDSVYFNYQVNTNLNEKLDFKFDLLNLNNVVVGSQTKTFTGPGTKQFNLQFDSIPKGEYTLRADVLKNGVVDSTSSYTTRVDYQAYLVLKAFDEDTSTSKLFSNKPILVELRVFGDNNYSTLINVETTSVKASINNINMPVDFVKKISIGVYQYRVVPTTSGKLKIEATTSTLGVTDKLVNEYDVESEGISVKFTNIDSILSTSPGNYNIKFETKNQNNELIDTENIVTVVIGGGGVSGTRETIETINGENGQYNFDYDFQDNGGYQIEIQSSSTGYDSTRISSPFLNIVQGGSSTDTTVTKECIQDTSCSSSESCINNICLSDSQVISGGTNLLWIIIGGIIIILVTLYFVFFKGKKKKRK